MKGCIIVRLEVPGVIQYRDIMLRTLSATCKLIAPGARARSSRASLFAAHLVSAVGEAYNNIALHGYAGREPGMIRMEIEQGSDWIRVVLADTVQVRSGWGSPSRPGCTARIGPGCVHHAVVRR